MWGLGITSFIVGHFNIISETCRTTHTQPPLLGYHCVLNNTSVATNLTSISHVQCRLACLSRNNCIVISYNHVYNYCELGSDMCSYLEQNEEFIVNLYGKDRRNCLEWVPLTEYDPQRAVAFLNGLLSKNIVAVARVPFNTGVYPGKYQLFRNYAIHVAFDNDERIVRYDGEVLLVNPGCYSAWLAYSVPNTIPSGAVSGCHNGKENLYVARAMISDNRYVIGYFRKDSGLVYYKYPNTVVKNDTAEILVLL